MTDLIHPFEKAGLGAAPFRFVGMSEKTYQACPGAPIQPGAACDYCGQGIRYVFNIQSSDGRHFGVGCDCVRKTTSKGVEVLTDVERALRRFQREQRQAKTRERVTAAKAALEQSPALLTDEPHSHSYWAEQGRTRRDEMLWLLDNAGQQGQNKACATVERCVA